MTERERLIELILDIKYNPQKTCPLIDAKEGCSTCGYNQGPTCDQIARGADYLLNKGIIVPPCPIGTSLYMIVEKRAKVTREYFRFIKKTKLTYYNLERVLQDYGKTVFLDPKEAQEALSKLQSSKQTQ